MEWMLQAADEIDDALCALWQCCLGLAAEIGPDRRKSAAAASQQQRRISSYDGHGTL
jgi:hypothetical protein